MDGWKDTMASGADGYDGAVVRGIYINWFDKPTDIYGWFDKPTDMDMRQIDRWMDTMALALQWNTRRGLGFRLSGLRSGV